MDKLMSTFSLLSFAVRDVLKNEQKPLNDIWMCVIIVYWSLKPMIEAMVTIIEINCCPPNTYQKI